MESNKNMDQQLREALSRFSVHPSEKQQSLFLETASKLAISKKRKRFFFITSGFLIGLTIITFFAINTKLPSNLKNTITKSEKSSVKVNVKTPQKTMIDAKETIKPIKNDHLLNTFKNKPTDSPKNHQINEPIPFETTESVSQIPANIPNSAPPQESITYKPETSEPIQTDDNQVGNVDHHTTNQEPSNSSSAKPDESNKTDFQLKKTFTEWESTMGIYYRPELIFNIIENDKWIHNFGIEFTFHPFNPRYVVRTGIGLSISKGFYEYKVDYNEYLGSYNALDSVTFSLAENNFNLIPTYYFSTSDVYNENLSSYYTKLYRRFIYLQIPLELGYDFYKKGSFSMGLRTGPMLSLLMNQQTTELQLDPGKDKILQINRITPERIAANWQYMAGINFTKTLNHVILEFEPRVSYYFNSVYEKGDQTKSPYSVNIRFAVGLK